MTYSGGLSVAEYAAVEPGNEPPPPQLPVPDLALPVIPVRPSTAAHWEVWLTYFEAMDIFRAQVLAYAARYSWASVPLSLVQPDQQIAAQITGHEALERFFTWRFYIPGFNYYSTDGPVPLPHTYPVPALPGSLQSPVPAAGWDRDAWWQDWLGYMVEGWMAYALNHQGDLSALSPEVLANNHAFAAMGVHNLEELAAALEILSGVEITGVPSSQPLSIGDVSVEYQRGPDMGGGVGGLLYSIRPSSDQNQASSIKFNLSNGRGDVVAQSDTTGALTWTASYEAYGKRPVETGTNADRQRANTKEEDPTGLLNEGFRYRDIETGVWLSRDPAGFVDGPNLYAYVRQNPWTSFDPLGLWTGIFFGHAITIDHSGISGHTATGWDRENANFPRWDGAKAKLNALKDSPGQFLKGLAGGYLGKVWGSDTSSGRLGRDVGANISDAEAVAALGRGASAKAGPTGTSPAMVTANGSVVPAGAVPTAPAVPANVIFNQAEGSTSPTETAQDAQAQSQQATTTTPTPRKPSAQIRKEWEAENSKPWPKDEATGRNQDVAHKKALADEGTNDLSNVEPLPHAEHVQQHKDAGDFKRWGARSKKQ